MLVVVPAALVIVEETGRKGGEVLTSCRGLEFFNLVSGLTIFFFIVENGTGS